MIHNKLTLSISNFTEGCDSNSYNTLTDVTRRSNLYKWLNGADYTDNSAPSYGTTSPDWKGTGWYRVGNNRNITNQVTHKHCNTRVPGYLTSGHHPEEEGKTIPAKICFHGGSYGSCAWKMQIQIKKCKGFYIYYLPEAPVCNARVCTT